MTAPSLAPSFQPALHHLEEILRGLRSGRASTGLVEHLPVVVYGATTRLRDIASLSTPDPRTIQIEPWDGSAVGAIEKAITTSGLGVNPAVAGTVIRLNLPPLTEERRQELLKLVGKHLEDARIAVRNVREKHLREFKKRHDAGELSDDALRREKDALQTTVDEALQGAQKRAKEKEAELLGS